jgi:hypothetical protein
MPTARKHIVCVEETPYYHVTSRCVRRAFLCGEDPDTGQNYEHRRSWIERRVRVLSSIFSVELCAYAIMSNHYHLVVRLDPDEAANWSDDEVLARWTKVFRGPSLVRQYLEEQSLSAAELETLTSICAVYRRRLASLSWFMKCVNEPIARRANNEDGCKGHFWEARFHSQALKSKRALLTAMAYVDLNPIRALAARTPEESAYTSIRIRLCGDHLRNTVTKYFTGTFERAGRRRFSPSIRPLMPFANASNERPCERSAPVLPMREKDYLKLVDETGRAVARGKHGRIDPNLAPILDRIGLSTNQWLRASLAFKSHYRKGDLIQAA